MTPRNLTFAWAPFLTLMLSGCAITSSRSFPYVFLESVEETGLRSAMNLQSSGILQSLTLTGTVEIPPLLHVDYERPPYSIHWRVEDTSHEFDRIEISSITIQYQGESAEAFIPRKKERVLRFRDGSNHPDAWEVLHGKITRHEPVTITIHGIAVKKDGTAMEVCFKQSFEPRSYDNVTDWFTWCANV